MATVASHVYNGRPRYAYRINVRCRYEIAGDDVVAPWCCKKVEGSVKTRWIVGKPAGKLLRARVQRRLPHSIRDVYIRLKNVVTLTCTYVARTSWQLSIYIYIYIGNGSTYIHPTLDRSSARSLCSFDKSIQGILRTSMVNGHDRCLFLRFHRLRTVYFPDKLRSIVEKMFFNYLCEYFCTPSKLITRFSKSWSITLNFISV